jgi:hypothetical protein
VSEAFTSSQPERYLRGLFAKPDGVVVPDFAVGAGGWASQNDYPRYVADVNGDGYNDIVGYGYEGIVVSFGSAQGTFSEAALMLSSYGLRDGWHGNEIEPRFVAKVNDDDIADLVIFDQGNINVHLGTSDGRFDFRGPFITKEFTLAQGWQSQDRNPRGLTNYDGDGKLDLIGFGFYGPYLAMNVGPEGATFNTPGYFLNDFGPYWGWTSDKLFPRTTADVNGDGLDDIIGFGYAGTYVALRKGTTFSSPILALDNFGQDQGWSGQNEYPRQLADVNGDGRADIVGFGIEGVLVAFGQADGTFTNPSLMVRDFNPANGWSDNDLTPRMLADFDNDGRIDIVGFGAEGVLVGYNTGGFYFG